MNIKQKIQEDFIIAMKSKNEIAKSALSGIKAKITEAEKLNNNKELSNDDIIKVINKAIKQREESFKIYNEAGRLEMAIKEAEEAKILKEYMPKSLTEDELRVYALEIWNKIGGDNLNKRIGMTTGTMNKNFPGQFDNKDLQNILKEFTI